MVAGSRRCGRGDPPCPRWLGGAAMRPRPPTSASPWAAVRYPETRTRPHTARSSRGWGSVTGHRFRYGTTKTVRIAAAVHRRRSSEFCFSGMWIGCAEGRVISADW